MRIEHVALYVNDLEKIVKKQIYLHAKLFMVSMNIYEM